MAEADLVRGIAVSPARAAELDRDVARMVRTIEAVQHRMPGEVEPTRFAAFLLAHSR